MSRNFKASSSCSQDSSSSLDFISNFQTWPYLMRSEIDWIEWDKHQKEWKEETNDKKEYAEQFEEDQLDYGHDQKHSSDEQQENDVFDNHLQRSSERYSCYLGQLLRSTSGNPLLGEYYCRNGKQVISERWSDTFQSIMKLRIANHIHFQEEELVKFAHETLLSLQEIASRFSYLKRQDGVESASELLYLCPDWISIASYQKASEKQQFQISFKVTNYLEQLLLSEDERVRHLEKRVFASTDGVYYLAPELLTQLFRPQVSQKKESFDLEHFGQDEKEKETDGNNQLSCCWKGCLWSLGMILLRSIYAKRGDFLSQMYSSKGKECYLRDLFCLDNDSLFNATIKEYNQHNTLEKYLSFDVQDDYSWDFKYVIQKMLTIDPLKRPSIEDLLQDPIFRKNKRDNTHTHTHQPQESLSLGVFLSLVKQGIQIEWVDKLFIQEEIVEVGVEFMKNKKNKRRLIPLELLKSILNQKISQVYHAVRQEGVQKLSVEELIHRIARIVQTNLNQTFSLSRAKSDPKDEDSMSIKSEIVHTSKPIQNYESTSPKQQDASKSKRSLQR